MKDITRRFSPPSTIDERRDVAPFYRSVMEVWREKGNLRRTGDIYDLKANVAEKETRMLDKIRERDISLISALETRHLLDNVDKLYDIIDDELDAKRRAAKEKDEIASLKRALKKEKLKGKIAKRKTTRTETIRESVQRAFEQERDKFISECGGIKNMTSQQREDLRRGEELHAEHLSEAEVD